MVGTAAVLTYLKWLVFTPIHFWQKYFDFLLKFLGIADRNLKPIKVVGF